MYKMECVTTGAIATNCYTIINEDTNEAIMIDAAGRPEVLMRAAKETGIQTGILTGLRIWM